MNKDAEKEARAQTGAAPAVVDLRDRVPQLDDKALATLHTNALRLKDAGKASQRAAAAELLPVIDAELARRQEEKRASAPPRPPRAVKKKAKAESPAEG